MSRMALATILILVLPAVGEAQDRTGWGISATLGASGIRDEDGTETFDGSGFGMAADLEYRFSPHVALGVGVFTLGEASDTFNGVDTDIAVRGLDLYGRLIAPVTDTADLYARLGTSIYFTDIEPGNVNFLEAVFGEEATEFGLGLDLGRRERLAWRLEGRYFHGRDDESGYLVLAGINFQF